MRTLTGAGSSKGLVGVSEESPKKFYKEIISPSPTDSDSKVLNLASETYSRRPVSGLVLLLLGRF